MGTFRSTMMAALAATCLSPVLAPTLASAQNRAAAEPEGQPAPPPATALPPTLPDRSADLDRIFAAFARPDGPGCAVSAVQDGQTLAERAYGAADLEHDIANSPATVFEAGSVSKQVTAAAILLLARDGRLKLTDDIRKYLPDLPAYGTPVTIEQLLNHTAGLRDWGELAALQGWPRSTRAYGQADILDLIQRQKSLNFRPGAEYNYTNSGYNLLTQIVQAVSGQSLAAFSAARIFQPLSMAQTQWRDDFRRIVKGRAIAYQRRPASAGGGYEQQMPFEDGYGNGGLLTTVGDLQRWSQALASDALAPGLTSDLQRQGVLSDGTVIPYARGVIVTTWSGVPEVSHSGATAAYRAWLGRYPDQKLSVAVLCNASDAPALPLGRAVAGLFLPPPPPPAPVQPLADVAGRAGLFVNQRTGRPLLLTVDGDSLKVAGGERVWPLTANSVAYGADTMVFEGRDAFVLKTFDGNRHRHVRTPLWFPAPEALPAFVGRYYSDEINATYRVALEGGRLTLKLEARPQPAVAMGPVYQDSFNLAGNLARFKRDSAGRVTSLHLGSSRVRDLKFRRIGD